MLVTGASSGIGAAAAREFARQGARLAICARRLDRLQEVADECRRLGSPSVTTRRTDVSRPAEVRAFVAAARLELDRIDVLVNNAGAGWRGRAEDMTDEQARALIEVNLLGPVVATSAVLPVMRAQNSGVIINVSSVVGFRAMPYSAVYSATKHALAGLSHALRGELSGTGVKVVTLYPGTVETEFFGDQVPDTRFRRTADQIGRLVVAAARRPRRDVIVFPFRAAQVAEPLLGGPLDHVLGETRRRQAPGLSAQDPSGS